MLNDITKCHCSVKGQLPRYRILVTRLATVYLLPGIWSGRDIITCQPTAHRFAFSNGASLRVGQTRADSASLRFVPVMMSSRRGAPASPLTPGGVESSVSHGRRPLRESLDIRALPPSRRLRPSRERQTGVTGRFLVRRAEPTFLADEMSAPADFQVNDAVSEERTSGRSDALSVRTYQLLPTGR